MTRTVHAREHRVVRGIRVTRGTHAVCVAVTRGEPGVIERRPRPTRRRMARLARRGESCGGVIRICRPAVVR